MKKTKQNSAKFGINGLNFSPQQEQTLYDSTQVSCYFLLPDVNHRNLSSAGSTVYSYNVRLYM